MFISKAQEISDRAKKQTLFTEVGLENDLIIKGDNSNEYELASVIYAQLGVGYRNYYNIYKREAKGKRTGLNGSNYYGINGNIFPFKDIYRSKNYDSLKRHYELEFVWGLRRDLGSRFAFDFNLGPRITNNTFKKNTDPDLLAVNWMFSYCF